MWCASGTRAPSRNRTFFVTDRIDGLPFTTDAGASWATWRPRVVGLLDVLARVHLAGVVHRDLKPANVLVNRDGRVVILDFGLAQGRLVERSTGGLVEGTPRYMAPEQRAALPSDERTDLYAVGGMILELVTGEPLTNPPRLDRLRKAPVPPVLVEMVERMLAVSPADRPESALEVLTALGADPRLDIGAGMPAGPWTEEQLRALFVDRKRSFLHLAEDAAELLFAETAGDEAATRRVLDRWILAGLASWSGDGRNRDHPLGDRANRRSPTGIAAVRAGGDVGGGCRAGRGQRSGPTDRGGDGGIGSPGAGVGGARRGGAVGAGDPVGARVAGGPGGVVARARDGPGGGAGVVPGAAGGHRSGVQDEGGDAAKGSAGGVGGEPQRALEVLAEKPAGLPEPLETTGTQCDGRPCPSFDLQTHERELVGIEGWAERTPTGPASGTGGSGTCATASGGTPRRASSSSKRRGPGRSIASGPSCRTWRCWR